MLILDVLGRNVAERGDRTFIHHAGRRVTYGQFDRLTNRAAHALQRLGVDKGNRVTLALGNSIEYVVAAFGVLKAGGVLNPVNPGLGAQELSYILGHAEPRVVVTDGASAPNVLSAKLTLPRGCTVAVFGADPSGALQPHSSAAVAMMDELIDVSRDDPPAVDLQTNDPSTLLYTSGTTGNPKGVLFTHGRTGTSGPQFIEALHLTPDDIILAVTPLFHGNAWGAVVTALHAGSTVVFPKAFHASEFWPLVHEVKATVLYTLGTVLAMLLTREPSDLERHNSLRVILGLGSAPIRDQIIKRFGVIDVAECFGSTDAGVVTITPLGATPRAGSCGPAVPGVQLRITADDGRALGPREVGEICVRSPAHMAAYFRDPEQTAQALRDGWFFTGDLGYLDEDGWLYFVDRKRDVIRRGGENISSVLIEKTLREHPSVAEAAVIGVPDAVLGQEVKAFIVAKAPVSADELRAFAAARLAKFQVPRLWEFRDSLPKTPSQRVEKYKLRAEHGATKPLLG
ncbi:MAG TPA: AMP-binding protein [Candidatus Margulisiibacteriota bacterium]|nr:AMP-binding protein [Candidatus Margulisiibacteriota bacterium]